MVPDTQTAGATPSFAIAALDSDEAGLAVQRVVDGFEQQDVGAAFDQAFGLHLVAVAHLIERDAAGDRDALGRRAHRSRHEARLVRGAEASGFFPCQTRGETVDFARVLLEAILGEHDRTGLEARGLDNVGAGFEKTVVHAANQVWPRAHDVLVASFVARAAVVGGGEIFAEHESAERAVQNEDSFGEQLLEELDPVRVGGHCWVPDLMRGGNQLSYPSDANRAILRNSRARALPSMSTKSQSQAPGRLVLVTGGAGFIGSHLVDALVAAGLRVRVIDNFATGRREYVNGAAELIEGDIRDASSIADAFDGVDTVFHVAALPRIPLSIAKPVETHMTNVVGTLNVLIAARDRKIRRVVYSGSSSVYGEQASMPLVETMTVNPLNPYALQKYVSEQYARMFHRLFAMQTITLRYFGVYGPRMPQEGSYVLAIAAFLRARREGRPLEIHGDGEQTRDFTHVSDVVSANMLAMDSEIADGRALNIGRGENVSVNRVAAMIGGPTVHREARAGDMRDTLADRTEAERVLGWRPRVSIEEGIADLLKDSGSRAYVLRDLRGIAHNEGDELESKIVTAGFWTGIARAMNGGIVRQMQATQNFCASACSADHKQTK